MPKIDQPESDSSPILFKFSILGAPKGTAYSIYLNNNPRRYSQGVITSEKTVLQIPDSFAGNGYITFTTPRVDRLVFASTFTHNFVLDQDVSINIPEEIKSQQQPIAPKLQHATSQTPDVSPSKKLLGNKLKDQVQEKKQQTQAAPPTGKKLITNKLQQQVQANKPDSPQPADNQLAQLSKIDTSGTEQSKKNFWDRFK